MVISNIIFIKHLDEDLIKWGWPEDVWFHVDKYSSAHVYLRLHMVKMIYVYSDIIIVYKYTNKLFSFISCLGSNNR